MNRHPLSPSSGSDQLHLLAVGFEIGVLLLEPLDGAIHIGQVDRTHAEVGVPARLTEAMWFGLTRRDDRPCTGEF